MNTSSVISQNVADVQLWQRRVGLTHQDMKRLAKHVAAQLEERSFCVVFEGDLERCWPRKGIARSERERKIQAFAKSRGWTAAIVDGAFGTRQYFEDWNPGPPRFLSPSFCKRKRTAQCSAEMFLRKLIAQPDGNWLLLCRIVRWLTPAIVEQRDNCGHRQRTIFLPGIGALWCAVRRVAARLGVVRQSCDRQNPTNCSQSHSGRITETFHSFVVLQLIQIKVRSSLLVASLI
jgi:hypothetical protein